MDDDSSSMQPVAGAPRNRASDSYSYSSGSGSSSSSVPQCPPPLEPLVEPSYHTQVLLKDMFSQQALMRNYCPDSMQAIMMALDEQRTLDLEMRQEEEASLALAKALQDQDQAHSPPETSSDDNYLGSNSSRSGDDSSSLDIPDYFTTQEAQLSHMSLVGFQQEIMPIPPMNTHHLQALRQEGEEKAQDVYYDELAQWRKDYDSTDEKKRHYSPNRQRLSSPARLQRHATAPMPPPTADSQSCAAATASSSSSSNSKTKSKKKKTKKDRQCLICHRSTAECRLRMRKLSCGHQFCRSCIDRWLETKDTCPYCRQQVSEKTREKVRRQYSVGPTAA